MVKKKMQKPVKIFLGEFRDRSISLAAQVQMRNFLPQELSDSTTEGGPSRILTNQHFLCMSRKKLFRPARRRKLYAL